ncbi:MAG: hypothetical protein LBG29_03860 [Synergistaceae bacterium]|nr:hypothetical protein [Synergistaceae bacterium]
MKTAKLRGARLFVDGEEKPVITARCRETRNIRNLAVSRSNWGYLRNQSESGVKISQYLAVKGVSGDKY